MQEPVAEEQQPPWQKDELNKLITERRSIRNQKLIYWFVALVAFELYDISTRDAMFAYSIPKLQYIQTQRTDTLTIVFSAISELSDKYAYVFFIGLIYMTMDASNSFISTMAIYSACAILSVLKSFNTEPRPFFVADLQPATKCWNEYGSPSGHSLTSASLYFTVWKLICRTYRPSNLLKYLSLSLTILIVIAIGVSRLYMGVHTLNQIFSGWILGLFIHILFCDILNDELTTFVHHVHRYSVWELFWNKGTISFYTFNLIAFFNFQFGETLHPVPAEWEPQIAKNCQHLVRDEKSPELYNFVAFCLYLTFSGSYFGLIVERKFFNTRKYSRFYETPIWKTLLRCILIVLICSPFLICIFTFPKNYHWSVVVMGRCVVPTTLAVMELFVVSKWIFVKLGLANDHESTDEELELELIANLTKKTA